jgi:DNA-binding NtrC family response regulator
VRELENIVERAFIFTSGNIILAMALGLDTQTEQLDSKNNAVHHWESDKVLPHQDTPGTTTRIVSSVYEQARAAALAAFEQDFLVWMLGKHKGNVGAAAQEAQVTRQYFYRMMRRYNISSDIFRNA